MNSCVLAIGTNKGDRFLNIENSIAFISSMIGNLILRSSTIETPALLLPNSPKEWDLPFLNLVISIQTSYSILKVFSLIKEIESKMGRNTSAQAWSPRIIDIDIITYNNLIYSSDTLIVPHQQMHKRLFVLRPLSEILPHSIHPVFNKTFKNLHDELVNYS